MYIFPALNSSHSICSQKYLRALLNFPCSIQSGRRLPVLCARGRVDDGVGAAVSHGGGAHRAGVGQDVEVVAPEVLAEAAVRQVDVGGRAALAQLVRCLADGHDLGVGRGVAGLSDLSGAIQCLGYGLTFNNGNENLT